MERTIDACVGTAISQSCEDAEHLMDTYTEALATFHRIQVPVLRGIELTDPWYAEICAAKDRLYAEVSAARRSYWAHVQEHSCRKPR